MISNNSASDKWYSFRVGTDPIFSPVSTFFISVDFPHKVLIMVYFCFTVVAYFWTQVYIIATSHYLCEMIATPGAGFNAVDLYSCGICAAIFMLFDFWESGFSIYTFLYIFCLSLSVGISTAFPLYLGMRVSRRCKMKDSNYLHLKNDLNSDLNKSIHNSKSKWLILINPIFCIWIIIWYYLQITPFSTNVKTCTN